MWNAAPAFNDENTTVAIFAFILGRSRSLAPSVTKALVECRHHAQWPLSHAAWEPGLHQYAMADQSTETLCRAIGFRCMRLPVFAAINKNTQGDHAWPELVNFAELPKFAATDGCHVFDAFSTATTATTKARKTENLSTQQQ